MNNYKSMGIQDISMILVPGAGHDETLVASFLGPQVCLTMERSKTLHLANQQRHH